MIQALNLRLHLKNLFVRFVPLWLIVSLSYFYLHTVHRDLPVSQSDLLARLELGENLQLHLGRLVPGEVELWHEADIVNAHLI